MQIYKRTSERHYSAGLVTETQVGPFDLYTQRGNPANWEDRTLRFWRISLHKLIGFGMIRNALQVRVFVVTYKWWPRLLRLPVSSVGWCSLQRRLRTW